MSKANLRCCASCEWIFLRDPNKIDDDEENYGFDCPKCGFVSYAAHYVYDKKCYKYAKTQEPWLERKISKYRYKLLAEIKQEQIDIIADKVDKIFSRH
jgi:predicted RNA-binding Zn-ribbon protein involved in translation (DUF1610 family)